MSNLADELNAEFVSTFTDKGEFNSYVHQQCSRGTYHFLCRWLASNLRLKFNFTCSYSVHFYIIIHTVPAPLAFKFRSDY